MGNMETLKITTLIENNEDYKKQLNFEHGLSLYIELENMKILFDTGQSGKFKDNAKKLEKSLKDLDYLIISHGHYDHAGGVEEAIKELGKKTKVIVGREFFNPKYKQLSENSYKYNGISFNEDIFLKNNLKLEKIEGDILNIGEKIIIFHNFERETSYEKINDKFYIKNQEKYIRDDFKDEIAMGVKTDKGLVVIVGCSHIGIINILKSISKKIDMPIYMVIGGTHLVEADKDRIDKTILDLKKMNIEYVALSHCTGEEGIEGLQKAYKDKFIKNNTGNIIKI